VLHLHDSATGEERALTLREPGKVSMYVCGPTVYGPPHLGHGRFSLVFDVLRRYLEWSGFEVTYVSNITDIDDNIINRAEREGREWQEITQRCEAVWYQAMDAIGVKRPDSDPHATAYVDDMVKLIGQLIDVDAAYVTDDGVYFRTSAVADYGLLARQSLESLQVGARIQADTNKESAIDFALWKFSKPGEPSWDSPWGGGRPGWHTECVVMSLDLLGDRFDIHGGGQDLRFPHHENERAQAVALGREFAGHWVHNGFVEVGGEKMSKSSGNFTNLLDLIEAVDPRSYRMLCLQSHYRSPIDVDGTSTANAVATLDRLDAVDRRLRNEKVEDSVADAEVMQAFRERMDDDLDTPGATAVIFGVVTRLNTALDQGSFYEAASLGAAFHSMIDAVGLELAGATGEIPEDIQAMADGRTAARAARDFAEADRLRDAIVAAGWIVEDFADGAVIRPA